MRAKTAGPDPAIHMLAVVSVMQPCHFHENRQAVFVGRAVSKIFTKRKQMILLP